MSVVETAQTQGALHHLVESAGRFKQYSALVKATLSNRPVASPLYDAELADKIANIAVDEHDDRVPQHYRDYLATKTEHNLLWLYQDCDSNHPIVMSLSIWQMQGFTFDQDWSDYYLQLYSGAAPGRSIPERDTSLDYLTECMKTVVKADRAHQGFSETLELYQGTLHEMDLASAELAQQLKLIAMLQLDNTCSKLKPVA